METHGHGLTYTKLYADQKCLGKIEPGQAATETPGGSGMIICSIFASHFRHAAFRRLRRCLPA